MHNCPLLAGQLCRGEGGPQLSAAAQGPRILRREDAVTVPHGTNGMYLADVAGRICNFPDFGALAVEVAMTSLRGSAIAGCLL